MTAAVSGAEGSVDRQVVSYEVTLQNATPNEFVVRWVEPIPNEMIDARLVGESPRVLVDKKLESNGLLVINGQFMFNSSGVSKSEIGNGEPLIKDVVIATEMTLSVPR